MSELAKVVIATSKDGYPELEEKKEMILKVISEEENKFNKTIDQGLTILEDFEAAMKEEGKTTLDGADAFKLYDTYGFPLDLTKEILEEKGYEILSDDLAMVPMTTTRLTDPDQLKQMGKLLDSLEDNDDVQNVWHSLENEEDLPE